MSPVKRTAWACKWLCGHNVLTSKARMVAHEAICFGNPSRRACRSCANLRLGYDSYDTQVSYCRAGHDISEKWRHDCPAYASPQTGGKNE